MVLLRSALYVLILVLFTPPYWVLVLACAPLSRMARYRVIAFWTKTALWLARVICGIRYEVEGAHHIPAEPVVILAKHQSAWETIAFPSIFPPAVYLLKRELLWIPFFGWGLALFSPIAIDRSNRNAAMRRLIEQGRERLAQGFSIIVFPEGTRIPVGQRVRYKVGGATLAVNTGAKVLPVAHNAGLVWPRNAFLKHPGLVTVRIGEPISSEEVSPDALMRRVEDWIESQMPELVAKGGAHR